MNKLMRNYEESINKLSFSRKDDTLIATVKSSISETTGVTVTDEEASEITKSILAFQKKGLGTSSTGIITPIIEPGDDIVKIVAESVIKAVGIDGIDDGDIIAITEAVCAIAQNNYVTYEQIQKCIAEKFGDTIGVVFPIFSRNRSLSYLNPIVTSPTIKKVYYFFEYPCDEVGNPLVSEELFYEKNIDSRTLLTTDEFCQIFGEPIHPFTGVNYFKEFEKSCLEAGKEVTILLCNDPSVIANYCDEALVCTIHEPERSFHKKLLKESGVKTVYDLSEIMNEPINGSAYSPEYGLYGSNAGKDNDLKLMPRDTQLLVEAIQKAFKKVTGKKVEVMVFGDGAFKDPVGKIWELADPTTTLAMTSGLEGLPKEIKLKLVARLLEGLSREEKQNKMEQLHSERQKTESIDGKHSLGTTPRQISDLVASLSDLTCGSGDKQTPVILIKRYFRDNFLAFNTNFEKEE